MKALTLWRPWAGLLVCGLKGIETRYWGTKYRGPLIICTSQRSPSGPGTLRPPFGYMDPRPYDGVAIGVVVVSDCRPHRPEDSALSLVPHDERLFSWVTSDRRVFERVPVKGKMGLWTPPQALINIAAAALSAPQASEPQALT